MYFIKYKEELLVRTFCNLFTRKLLVYAYRPCKIINSTLYTLRSAVLRVCIPSNSSLSSRNYSSHDTQGSTFDSSGAILMHLCLVGHPGTILPVDIEVMMGNTDVLPLRGLGLMRLLDKYINAQ